ncbi:MAG: GNAT family N-acetyltransferase [bacterium]|nr:GNAT family N-acetyltransferase [bacterium]
MENLSTYMVETELNSLILLKNDAFTARVATEGDTLWTNTISNWISNAGPQKMIPKDISTIARYFRDQDSVLVFSNEGLLVGHIAFTYRYGVGNERVEIGSLCINPEFGGKGIATMAVQGIIRYAALTFDVDTNIFAMCNQESLHIFVNKVGGIIVPCEKTDNEVYNHCELCPRAAGASTSAPPCRHTHVDLTRVVASLREV